MEKGAWLLGGVCLLTISGLIFIRTYEVAFHAALDWSFLPHSWKGKIKHLAGHFISSTSGLSEPRYIIETMGLSLVVWIIEGSFLFFMAHAFGVSMKYSEAFFLLFALGLSVTLPQAPGYVGTYEFFGVTALTLLGISKDQGLPLVLAIHGTQFIFVSIFGIIGLWQEGLTLNSLTISSTAETGA
jgi:uncharacterized membrane protein YbhN (UPF0104 family)